MLKKFRIVSSLFERLSSYNDNLNRPAPTTKITLSFPDKQVWFSKQSNEIKALNNAFSDEAIRQNLDFGTIKGSSPFSLCPVFSHRTHESICFKPLTLFQCQVILDPPHEKTMNSLTTDFNKTNNFFLGSEIYYQNPLMFERLKYQSNSLGSSVLLGSRPCFYSIQLEFNSCTKSNFSQDNLNDYEKNSILGHHFTHISDIDIVTNSCEKLLSSIHPRFSSTVSQPLNDNVDFCSTALVERGSGDYILREYASKNEPKKWICLGSRVQIKRNLANKPLGCLRTSQDYKEVKDIVKPALAKADFLIQSNSDALKESLQFPLVTSSSLVVETAAGNRSLDRYISNVIGEPEIWVSKDLKKYTGSESISANIILNGTDAVTIEAWTPSPDIRECFRTATNISHDIENTLIKDSNIDYDYHPKIGHITCNPIDLGTGLKLEYILHLPYLTKRKDLIWFLKKLDLNLTYIGDGDDCIVLISNKTTWSYPEVSQANKLITGVSKIVWLENELQRGRNIENVSI